MTSKASNKPGFLIETCLLTHGLSSVSNQDLKAVWPKGKAVLAWMDAGTIILGTIDEYLPFRRRAPELIRIDGQELATAAARKASGALTASGTMAVAAAQGVKAAVSCGIGGIGAIIGEELCPDLPALAELPVALIATAPKDMLDIPATLNWLQQHGVLVLGKEQPECTGYILNGAPVALDGVYDGSPLGGRMLLLNGIPSTERLSDERLLAEAIAAGKAAEERGQYYHPAANARFDQLTLGYSSRLQLGSLIANICWAQQLTDRGLSSIS
ncbi:MAG: pseudouridine-5'-phosphate glycosidase [Syntrophomonadaceae bacterium]|nr:pseudouridine-5'-phosphate glycosidase [Syntrophomonadaceae bacterium]